MITIKNIPSALFSFWVLLLTEATTLATNAEDTQVNSSCLPGERTALLTLKTGFVDPKNRLSSWKGHDCCRWSGVTCSKATGHVLKLDLRNTYIGNSEWNFFPDYSYAFGGGIHSSLLSLRYLNYLDLSYNNFSYTKIPHFFGSLNELKYLNLSFSHFGGRIPLQFGNLSNLQYLDLSSNYNIDGKIPPQLRNLSNLQYLDLSRTNIYSNDVSWLADLTSLKHLDLSFVNLNNSIHWDRLGMLPHLQALYLSNCDLNETTFSLSHANFTMLSTFHLSGNKFSNPQSLIWVWNMTCLRSVDFSFNNFDSCLPNALRNMNSIQELYLGFNNLMDMKTSDLKNLTNLRILDLSDSRLTRDITKFIEDLSLYRLQYLDLEWNNFYGNLSGWIGHMTCLTNLRLSNNNLSGPIPIRKLTQLIELDLGQNNFNGVTTEKHFSKMTNLSNFTNLKTLTLSRNQLTRDITEFIEDLSLYRLQYLDLEWNNFYGNLSGWIGHMTDLTNLQLCGNNLSGPIPLSIRKLTQLIELDLSQNNLSGSIPLSIRKLAQLIVLDLGQNNFNGVVTEKHLSKMTNLKTIDLSQNSLSLIVAANWLPPFRLRHASLSSCRLGPKFPEWLKWQTNILYLDISNAKIADKVPVWFWHVFSKALDLDLSKNNLSGFLPESLEFMSVTSLFLSENQFQGLVPKLPKRLSILDLSKNAFSGFLSSNWENLILWDINLRQNSLNGSIPQFICQLKLVYFLDLSRNFLVGNIPNCGRSNPGPDQKNYSRLGSSTKQSLVEQKYYPKLVSLILSYNNLSGEFSKHLTHFSNLIALNLDNNNFFGSIPPWIVQKLPSLRMLLLGSNRFNGTMPDQLFQLEQLQILDLSNNNLYGIIPCSMRTLIAMTIKNVTNIDPGMSNATPEWLIIINYYITSFVIEVDTKGERLDFKRNILDFKSLDLSGNNLVGNIPEEIGALEGLTNLNLSRNKLSGFIPRSIGNLKLLESLDFSNNGLSGSIPSSMADLTFLSRLNMSYNNLSGRIPSGRQLQTLNDPSIYEGNNGLCGFPLPIECYESKRTSQSFVSENKNSHEFYVGAIIGFAVGAWMVYGALLFNKSWRVAYFVFFDNMYDSLKPLTHM